MSHEGNDSSTRPTSRNSQQKEMAPKDESESSTKPIKIEVQSAISSVALLGDVGQQFVTGDKDGKIRYWRMQDGEETGAPIDAGSAVRCIATSQDGKWIVVGTQDRVIVWDAESRKKLKWFQRGSSGANSIDISSDGTKIVIAWDDKYLDVHTLPDGKWLRGGITWDFHTAKFSPDGLLLAYGAEDGNSSSLHIDGSQDDQYLGGIFISTRSIAWASDSKKLFALSSDGNIHCVDASNVNVLSQWPIHSDNNPRCISLSNNGAFIAASANSSVSFWDISTHEQIGPIIHHPHSVNSMALSPNYDLTITGDSTISLWDLFSVLPDQKQATSAPIVETTLNDMIIGPRSGLAEGHLTAGREENALDKTTHSLRADLEAQKTKSMNLEKTVEELRTELANSQQKHDNDIKSLETTIQQLRTQLSDSEQNAKDSSQEIFSSQQKHGEEINQLEATIQQLRTQLSDSQQNVKDSSAEISGSQRKHGEEINRLEATIQQLRTQLSDSQQNPENFSAEISNSQRRYGEKIKKLEATIQQLHAQLSSSRQNAKYSGSQGKHGNEMNNLKRTVEQLRSQLSAAQQNAEKFSTELSGSQQVVRTHQQKHHCETLYTDGHVIDAAKSLLDITRSITDDVKSDAIITDWLSVFTTKCLTALEQIGDKAFQTRNDGEALAAYTTALSLSPSSQNTFLSRWVSSMLLHGSTGEILEGARELKLPKLAVYRATCDVLEGAGRVTEAIECFREMCSELTQDEDVRNEQAKWDPDFPRRYTERLGKLADDVFSSQNYDEADKHYSAILSLDQPDRAHTLVKRSNTRAMMKSWEDALMDADEAIKLDPSSYRGYECRHAALHGASRHAEAVLAFDTMLLKLRESPNARVRGLLSQYQDARRIIRGTLQATSAKMPRVLIDTTTGHLCDRTQLAETFETLPVFNELVSSMTREIDEVWIRREVTEFCGYVMFSHKWEYSEPLFQTVMHVTVYKLEASRGNTKLQTFCSIVRSLGFRWAWSDTCCIDKSDNVVLQESLVAMFAWYRGSSLTIIHLLGVSSLSEVVDALRESIWNSRVWTRQEYVAAKRVLFYTEDWKPYLGLTLENHKESPIIQREMELPEVSSEQVAILLPGLDRIREKLYLASTRETTLVEDIAYSLLGILNTSIPIIYGEGTRAVGRLLEHVLAASGDATILAWTGTSNEYNSCLPLNLTVYNLLVPPHIPRMETADLDRAVTGLRSSPDASLATTLYHEMNKLPLPVVASSRLRLSGIFSAITDVSVSGLGSQTYHVTTDLFGDIAIGTANKLTMMNGLCIVHPWIHPLLDQEFARGSAQLDSTTQALRLIARLQQPFGALLFEQVSRTEYKRVAADSLVMVQSRKEVSLTDLISNVRTIEVL